jgi:protein TonB
MTGAGFYEQQKFRPTGLALVVALHAAALAALVLVKGPEVIFDPPVRTTIDFIPLPKDPPEDPPPPVEADNPPPPSTEFTAPQRDFETTTTGPETTQEPRQEDRWADATSTLSRDIPDLPPVRVSALFDPRFARDQQPPYPTSEERAQREGQVRIRVTIGADGRVRAVQRLSATSDAFWRSTERHALSRWRFRPATVDGRPVESTKDLTITFQIQV